MRLKCYYYLCFFSLVMLSATNLQAQLLNITKSADVTNIETGIPFTYTLQYSCASTTEDCEGTFISDPLPPEVEYISLVNSAHIASSNYNSGTHTVTFTFIDPLPAGSTGEVLVSVRFPNGTTPNGTIASNTATIDGSNSSAVNSNTVDVTAFAEDAAAFDKYIDGGCGANDTTVYVFNICNDDQDNLKGMLNLSDITIQDVLPSGAIFLGGDYATESGGTVTVTYPGILEPGQCEWLRILVRYPDPPFSVGQTVTNSATFFYTPVGEIPAMLTDNTTCTLSAPSPGVGLEKVSKYATMGQGQGGVYYIQASNTGTTTLKGFYVEDAIPGGITVTKFTSGAHFDPCSILTGVNTAVTILYQTNLNSTYQLVPGSPFPYGVATEVDVSSLGLSSGEYITQLRWEYGDVCPGFLIWERLEISFVVNDDAPTGTAAITNCASFGTTTSGAVQTWGAGAECVSINITASVSGIYPGPQKEVFENGSWDDNSSQIYGVGDVVQLRIRAKNGITASDPIQDPVIVDLLPLELDYVPGSWTSSSLGSAPAPIFTEIPNYNGTGRTLLKWEWTGASSFSLVPGDQLWSHFDVLINDRAVAGTGSLINEYAMLSESSNGCEGGIGSLQDIYDFDNDGSTTDFHCRDNISISIASVPSLDSEKLTKGQLDVDWTKYPAFGSTVPGGLADYRLTVTNSGTVPMTNVVVVDILPFVGDAGVIDLSPRNSRWRPVLVGPVDAPDDVVVYYSTSGNPCRDAEGIEPSGPAGCQPPNWSVIPPVDITSVQSLKFEFGSIVMFPGDAFELEWPMRAPVDVLNTIGSVPDTIAWNSFGYIADKLNPDGSVGDPLLPAEPIKVGIALDDYEPGVYGDMVWLDNNQNGLFEPGIGEVGLDNVMVELYRDNGDGINNPSSDIFVNYVLTMNGGQYWFPNLLPGNYYALFHIPPTYALSPADVGSDDTIDSDGIASSFNGQNVAITPITSIAAVEVDDTWDLGLYQNMPPVAALGNYVWHDENQDGIQNESLLNGLNGIVVNIYEDVDGDGNAEPNAADGSPIATTFTADDIYGNPGYYLFDNLDPNEDYFLEFVISPSFSLSTQGATGSSDPTDSDPNPTTGLTEVIAVNGDSFDRSWDAGVILPDGLLSIGDRVWIDTDNDGNYALSNGDYGLDGVEVVLHRDMGGGTGSCASSVFCARISASSDDAEEKSPTTVSLTSSDMELTTDGSTVQTIGLRFNNISLPQGAVINSAYIQFTVDELVNGNPCNLTIRGQDSDNTLTFSSTNIVTSRPTTTASVNWSPPDWTATGIAGPDQQTPDLSAIVQEIVNRPGWLENNSMAFIIDGTGIRIAEAFDGVPEAAPLLCITYTETYQAGDGTFNPNDDPVYAVTSTFTNAGEAGYYRFDNAPPGDYFVQIAPSNFNVGQPLHLAESTDGNGVAPDPDNDLNSDDNGEPLAGYGVMSQAVTLCEGTEPINDGDNDPNTNMTLDFGFREACQLGIDAVIVGDCYDNAGSSEIQLQVVVSWNSGPGGTITVSTTNGSGQTQQFNTDVLSSPQTVLFTADADGSTYGIQAAFDADPACNALDTYTAPGPCPLNPCAGGANEVGGTIFMDYNSNGVQDTYETIGVGNITVTAYRADGLSYSTTSDYNGSYSIVLPAGSFPVRVEFTNIPPHLQATFNGTDSRTTVQFVDAATCLADLGLVEPDNYCQENPFMSTPCYLNGDPLPSGSFGYNLDVLVSVGYDYVGQGGDAGYTPPSHLALGHEVGSTWGLAYQRDTKTLFASAFLKRHVGFGPLGTGGIYKLTGDLTGGSSVTVQNFVDLSTILPGAGTTGADPRIVSGQALPTTNTPNYDSLALSQVGKIAFGDMDISPDGDYLWVMSLADRTLYRVYIGNPPQVPTLADVTAYPVPNPGCSNGDYRPWAVKASGNTVYVGVVCSAEASQNVSDLYAHVYSLNITSANYQLVLSFPLDYTRPSDDWHPWTSSLPWSGSGGSIEYPQPILSDIEIDIDGSLVLGFIDRLGHQTGRNNYSNDPADGNTYNGESWGDILRACNDNGILVIENNGLCPDSDPLKPGQGNNDGPGGGEYYWGDVLPGAIGNPNGWGEIAVGGLALLPGSGEVVSTVYDPLRGVSGGMVWFDNQTGGDTRRYEVFYSSAGTFGKTAGLGDVELFCDNAPIEIGNYVWLETDIDGVQGPDESPLQGVNVTLFNAVGSVVATTTTDANGEYYFSKDGAPNQVWTTSGDSLYYNTTYYIAVGTGGQYNAISGLDLGGGEDYDITTPDIGEGIDPDLNDSDGIVGGSGDPGFVNGLPFTIVQTGGPGESDHSFDFGFKNATEICDDGVDNDGDNLVDCDDPDCAVSSVSAGADEALCDEVTTTLNGSGLGSGTGQWTLVYGTGATISSPNSPSTTIGNMALDECYTFRWTVTSASGCSAYDEVEVCTYSDVVANAGADQNLYGVNSTNLSATTPPVGDGYWALTQGSNLVFSVTNPNTMVYGLQSGVYEFTWTVTNGNCVDSDTMTITVLNCPPTPVCTPLTIVPETF